MPPAPQDMPEALPTIDEPAFEETAQESFYETIAPARGVAEQQAEYRRKQEEVERLRQEQIEKKRQ